MSVVEGEFVVLDKQGEPLSVAVPGAVQFNPNGSALALARKVVFTCNAYGVLDSIVWRRAGHPSVFWRDIRAATNNISPGDEFHMLFGESVGS